MKFSMKTFSKVIWSIALIAFVIMLIINAVSWIIGCPIPDTITPVKYWAAQCVVQMACCIIAYNYIREAYGYKQVWVKEKPND